jgi:hypothetical protein
VYTSIRHILLGLVMLGLVCVPTHPVYSFQRKSRCTVRFFMETAGSEAGPFATAITLHHPTRQSFVENVASISERQIAAATCYPASDGSWGCLFELDNSGRLTLQNISSANRGRTLIAHIGNEKFSRQVQEIYIDRAVSDGLLPIPRGLTYAETVLIQKNFRPIRTEREP